MQANLVIFSILMPINAICVKKIEANYLFQSLSYQMSYLNLPGFSLKQYRSHSLDNEIVSVK